MACALVWRLERPAATAAADVRSLWVRLSGRQRRWGREATAPAQRAGRWVLWALWAVLAEHRVDELRRFKKLVLAIAEDDSGEPPTWDKNFALPTVPPRPDRRSPLPRSRRRGTFGQGPGAVGRLPQEYTNAVGAVKRGKDRETFGRTTWQGRETSPRQECHNTAVGAVKRGKDRETFGRAAWRGRETSPQQGGVGRPRHNRGPR